MKYFINFSIIVLFFTHIYCQGNLENILEDFIRGYRHNYDAPLPEDLKKILDAHSKELDENKRCVNHFDWLPDWMVKCGERRIEGAKRFSVALDELRCHNFIVPKKYRYISPEGHNYTISEVIKEDSENRLTLEELKQLLRVAKKLNWLRSTRRKYY